MKSRNFDKGREGEARARAYLENLGWRTIAQNFRTRWGEIDLIMDDGEKLVFVEVKSKNPKSPGEPHEMITKHKILQIKQTALAYLMQQEGLAKIREGWRIDAVCLKGKLVHYQNIG